MEKERLLRYKDKLNRMQKRSQDIEEWTDLTAPTFLKDEKTKLATYKAYQELVEACMDIIAMLCKDLKHVPKDDYTNIDVISTELQVNARILQDANGLRNRVIHRYNKTDDALAFHSIKDLVPELEEIRKVFEQWLKQA